MANRGLHALKEQLPANPAWRPHQIVNFAWLPAGAVVNQLADSDCRRLKRSRQIAQVAFGQRAWLLVQCTSVIWLEHRGIGRAGELEHRAT